MKRVYYLFAFISGVAAFGYFNLWQGILFAILLLIVTLFQRLSSRRILAFTLLFLVGGTYYLTYHSVMNSAVESFASHEKSATLKIVSQPETTSGGNTRLICKVSGKPFKILMYIRGKAHDMTYLDTVKVDGFTYYYTSENSYGEYLNSGNIFGNITIDAEQAVLLKRAHPYHPLRLFSDCRNHLLKILKTYFEGDSYQLIAGILLGDKSEQTDSFREIMSVSGVSHVVVVSGLHFGIWMTMISGFLLRLRLSLRKRSILMIGATIFFAFFMGMTPSIIRVSVMLILTFLCDLFLMNHDDNIAVVILSAFLSVIGNPNMILSVSFLLSYGAVLGILLFSEKISERLNKWKVSFKPLNGIISASLAAQILTFPFLVFYFNQFSIVFLLGNLLVCLILPFLMGYGLFFWITACFFPVLGSAVAYPLQVFLDVITGGLKLIYRIPCAAIPVYEVDKGIIIFYFLLLFLFCKVKWRGKFIVILGFCFLFTTFFFSPINLVGNGTDLICLNISDNTAYLFRTKQNKTILLDLSSDFERKEYHRQAFIEAVNRHAGGKIDCYIAGGKEQAKMLGGIDDTIHVGAAFMPEAVRGITDNDNRIHYFNEDTTVEMENIKITLFCQEKDGLVTTAVVDYFGNHLLASSKMNEKRYAQLKTDYYDIVMINRYISTVYHKIYGSVAEWNADKIIYNLKEKNKISDCYNIGFYDRIKIKLFPEKNFVVK